VLRSSGRWVTWPRRIQVKVQTQGLASELPALYTHDFWLTLSKSDLNWLNCISCPNEKQNPNDPKTGSVNSKIKIQKAIIKKFSNIQSFAMQIFTTVYFLNLFSAKNTVKTILAKIYNSEGKQIDCAASWVGHNLKMHVFLAILMVSLLSNGQLNADLTTASLYNVLILDAFELLVLDVFSCRDIHWPPVHYSKVSGASRFFSKMLILFLHINARSLVPKLDVFKTWFMISKPWF